MFASVCSLWPMLWLLPGAGEPAAPGFLVEGARPGVAARVVRYTPREGDLIFYDDRSRTWTALFALAGTGPPLHMGIVVKKADGKLAVLEAGPDDRLWVELLDLPGRLHQFDRDFRGGIITVRRCKKTPSREQSAALTRFALAQKGKRYAAGRLLLQGTPLRARGRMAPLWAKTQLDRDAWICSELAVAAGSVAGLFDPRAVLANATYPRDLVDNKRHRLGSVWHDAARWQPARFPDTPAPGKPPTTEPPATAVPPRSRAATAPR